MQHEHALHRPLTCWGAASAWMFPWEKRQMEGGSGPLRTWERVYWGVFVTGLTFFLLSRLNRKSAASTEDPEAGHIDVCSPDVPVTRGALTCALCRLQQSLRASAWMPPGWCSPARALQTGWMPLRALPQW